MKSIGLFFLYQFAFIQLILGIFWLLGMSIINYSLLISFLLTSLLWLYFKLLSLKSSLLVVLIWLTSCLIASIMPDFSIDGQVYHQPIIFALTNGWNPVLLHHNDIINPAWEVNIWIDHYCKGLEFLSASIVSVTGNMESGKAVNILIPISSFLLLLDCLGRYFSSKLGSKLILLLSLVSCTPAILASQVFTYYIDWASYYIILLFLVGGWYIYNNNIKDGVLILIPTLYLAIGIKYNLTFWAFYFLTVIAFYCYYMKIDNKKLLAIVVSMMFVSAISVSLTNFNPYFSNIIDHGNPTYPISTNSDSNKFLDHGAQPNYMMSWNRVQRILFSMFTTPSNEHSLPHYPWEMCKYEDISNPACVVGGWGVLFPISLLLSIIFFILCPELQKKKKFIFFSIVIFATTLILPYGSCYRYVPFTSGIPLIFIIYILFGPSKKQKYIGGGLLTLLLINFFITFFSTSILSLSSRIATDYYVRQIKKGVKDSYVTWGWAFYYKVNKDYFNIDNENNKILDLRRESDSFKQEEGKYKRAHIQPYEVLIDTTKVDIRGSKSELEAMIIRNDD